MAWKFPWPRRAARTTAHGQAHLPEHKNIGFVALHAGGEAVWSRRDYASLSREGYMRNPIAYRAVRMIAEAAASVPWLLYEGAAAFDEHPLLDLLERPNPHQAGGSFLEALYGHLLLSGNAYIELAEASEEARELHLLRPDRVAVECDAAGWPVALDYRVGGGKRRIAIGAANEGGSSDLRQAQGSGLQLSLFHPLDDHHGFAPLEAALSALDIHNAAGRWNKALLDNSARPSGALVYAPKEGGNLSDEQFDRLKVELETGYSGSGRAGRPLLLEGGLDWKAMSLSPKDMDFMEARNGAARDIALAFGVPPMLLGIPGDNTYANYQEANRSFYRLTVLPLVARTAKEFSAWLGPLYGEGLRLWFDADEIEGLAAEREALWARVGAADFLSEDEKRAAVGYGARGDLAQKAGFRPNQPRVPAGNGDPSGEWTDEGAGAAKPVRSMGRLLENRRQSAHEARAQGRKRSVIAGGGARFAVESNPKADASAPSHEVPDDSKVAEFSAEIEMVAKEIGVDADLIRTVMYMETTHGRYSGLGPLADMLGVSKSILPMNINVTFWGDVFGSRTDLGEPLNNIRAGGKILRGIMANLDPSASVAEIATLYNDLGARLVTDYGACAEAVFRGKLWLLEQ